MDRITQWAALFKALSEPIRLRLVNLLAAKGELCVCDLVDALDASQSMVSRHLAYLRNSGWVESRREGQWIHYRLSSSMDPMAQAIVEILKTQGNVDSTLEQDLHRAVNLTNSCTMEGRATVSPPTPGNG